MGGIGTHVLLTLLEMGARSVNVWDDDVVSSHNRPTQFIYSQSDIGKPKVDGAVRFVEAQGFDTRIIARQERVDTRTRLSGIVISGVDSMTSRKEIWEALKASKGVVPLYIDGRIVNEFMHVMTVDPCNPLQAKLYESTLFDDGPRQADRNCTTREHSFSAQSVGVWVHTALSLFMEGGSAKEAVYRNLLHEARSVTHTA